jgi:predicted Fe-S protein YdhL (DUF1289 family)
VPKLTRRAGPIGLALTAYDIWKKLPPKQKRKVLKQVKKHGPTVARGAAAVARQAAKRATRR